MFLVSKDIDWIKVKFSGFENKGYYYDNNNNSRNNIKYENNMEISFA